MGANLKFFIGLLSISSFVILTFSSQDVAEVKIEEPVQDTGEPYNPEADLASIDGNPDPMGNKPDADLKTIPDGPKEISNKPDTPADKAAVGGDGEALNTGSEPLNTGVEPENKGQMQADTIIDDIETNIADIDIMGAEAKRVDDSKSVQMVNPLVEIDDSIDPYEEMDMMFQMKLASLHNASDFCKLLDIGCEVEEADDGDGEKVLVSGGSNQVALFDACNPREQTVALPKDIDPDISIWPTCTRALRCGGCCTSDVFSCEPTETSERFVRVFRTRQPYKGAQRFQFIDAKMVKIIEHTRCDAQCKVKAIHCNPLQNYQSRYCRCVCTNQNMRKTCTKDQIWDDNECACVCPQRKTTFCPHPSRFSDHLCKCTLMQEVAGEIDLAQLLANYGNNIVVEPSNKITKAPTTQPPTTTTTTEPTTTTTPSTTTTTTAPPTTPDRCEGFPCPPMWIGKFDARRFKNNGTPWEGCRCLPAKFFGGGK